MKIGILGSACDPPHQGHIAAAELARKTLKLDRLILIPTKRPPHKSTSGVTPDMRLKMAKLAIRGRTDWTVSDMELRRRSVSYTIDTIRRLRKIYLQDKLFWIIGADSFVAMPWQWKGGYEILNECQFVVVPRKGYPLNRVHKKIRDRVIIIKGSGLWHLSSTKIRTMLKRGIKVPKSFLNQAVLRFIKIHKLYTW